MLSFALNQFFFYVTHFFSIKTFLSTSIFYILQELSFFLFFILFSLVSPKLLVVNKKFGDFL